MTQSTLYFLSELGWMCITANNNGITRIDFKDPPQPAHTNKGNNSDTDTTPQALHDAQQQLTEYFAGTRTTFDLPLDPAGTAFQKEVWSALATIPYGVTCSYKDIANQVNRPKGSQAIGQANGKNPISIVVPCHRVIGANGSLTGYAGGLERKAELLKREKERSVQTGSLRI